MAALFPLMVFWSTKYNDNAVVATAASIASLDASFAYYATDLGVVSYTSAAPGADVPLNFYFNPATGHHMTTASAAGNAPSCADQSPANSARSSCLIRPSVCFCSGVILSAAPTATCVGRTLSNTPYSAV